MAKGSKGRRRMASRQFRSSPYPLPCKRDFPEDLCPKNCVSALDKKYWEDATCSVCMEYPHNAVLLLCSSHDKGCRPYMCGTSLRYSNCLDQYKNAYTKVISSNHEQPVSASIDNSAVQQDSSFLDEKHEVTELACPLCRGQVKGWTVVEPAREYLNAKKRSCMQDSCTFVGNYKEIRKHVRSEHPSARPREVDPILEQKWRRLERERERNDVMSTIRSTMPGAVVFGDYVIEGNNFGFDSDEEEGGFTANAAERDGGFEVGFDSNLVNVFLLLHAFGPSSSDLNRRLRQPDRMMFSPRSNEGATATGIPDTTPLNSFGSINQDSDHGSDDDDNDNDNGGGMSLVSRLRRHGRVLLGRSGRRRRHRESNSHR
ncbi:uncharacterized protein LOC111025499 isoform X1 [Momordica charantia]|uniref:Uncharacterized protein LOC111025499 isoform X1 n=1 Tax=Momordica charantia TaxID=3673 RepID=A0A6J1DXS0_MOMCH|nr:uncharacterized protein LOC111025499 isoform X1 [Momordica charantia]